jgi:hypothetical protein
MDLNYSDLFKFTAGPTCQASSAINRAASWHVLRAACLRHGSSDRVHRSPQLAQPGPLHLPPPHGCLPASPPVHCSAASKKNRPPATVQQFTSTPDLVQIYSRPKLPLLFADLLSKSGGRVMPTLPGFWFPPPPLLPSWWEMPTCLAISNRAPRQLSHISLMP